jgi:hypothetical protein
MLLLILLLIYCTYHKCCAAADGSVVLPCILLFSWGCGGLKVCNWDGGFHGCDYGKGAWQIDLENTVGGLLGKESEKVSILTIILQT